MRHLSAHELLDLWETSLHYPVLERSLFLLSMIYQADVDSVSHLSIGERDARLLAFRERIFGTRLINWANCPFCSTRNEWESDTGDLKLQELNYTEEVRVFELEQDGFHVEFRLPDSSDMIRLIKDQDVTGDHDLVTGCIHLSRQGIDDISPVSLPPAIIDAVEKEMSAHDPQADITMVLDCPDCGRRWEAPFDIMTYLWCEIDSWAGRVLQEVVVLARALNWSEHEILSLSPQRRKMYLEMVI